MSQVLCAGRASNAGVAYRVHHGPGVLVHYSTVPAAGAPDNSLGFCLSTERLSMQQLNRRLASYLQQVQSLEVANQRLECQIQEQLDRKCPQELRQLDGHLKAMSLLQGQISDCLSAQAEVKLQLLGAELTIMKFSARCDKERERRGTVEAELGDMRLLQEGLLHILPELHNVWRDLTEQLMELQRQHQQDKRGLLAQASGGVAVEMQTTGSSDLIQQLEHLRSAGETLLHQEPCYNTQMSLLSSPAVTFDPRAESEVVQAEVEELWRTADGLEEELTQLQDLNMVLEDSSLQQTESFGLQLVDLQQKAYVLCRDLDSELQFAAQQDEEHQTLLEVNSRLETQIEDYRRLLDASSIQG
ncbi:keratin, type I cytoskeletal 14-like [Pseudochaenichthys georgianus]|uniref:keratin, type I cytoskeletal 14-like n=1 Tax=Pseudochaenichthys georgianus TaxID=52239 RepID=UPI00146D56FC|nr:keratin, type I cytoskeletal 19-like [Pseudochaenichthys georgianus]